MAKINSKRILKRAQLAGAREWTIVSYSIDEDVLDKFKQACKRQGVTMSGAVEEFMRDFSALKVSPKRS